MNIYIYTHTHRINKKEDDDDNKMGRSTIRKALGAVKDQTSIGLAKVAAGRHSLADLDVFIVKATRHEETPAEEKHIREILNLTCYSRVYVSACVAALSKRLARTSNWAVALKALVLVYRLLSEGDDYYEQEIFCATRRGARLLDMSGFRDNSVPDSWDYSAFVRTFARYLDERLEFRMHGRRCRLTRSMWDGYDGEVGVIPPILVKSTPVRDMNSDRILLRTHQLLQLLERFLACRPTGS